ncbi:SAVMC3_10250 family protein [Saccharothrix sp. NRRL B-16348]|uniref:SAVMC3_10250 family protein n=1 Tax=Saccharothrix sp. NRRL B-16348 TaxID=1415542 RepID=UPI000A551986|nr:SAVMC3_10250 family protein [Saccharothrix sp. NRRL B-16348]
MRDLLYLSENKMRVLSPQVPQQLRKKIGFETGVNVGFASFKTSLPSEPSKSLVTMLDSVIEMIEQERTVKWFTEANLQSGDWVQFEDEFFYGDAASGRIKSEPVADTGLVYFAAQRPPHWNTSRGGPARTPFVLVGSSANVLDRWQPPDSHVKAVGAYYMEAVLAYAERLAELPDEATESELAVPGHGGHALVEALRYLTPITQSVRPHSGWAAGPVTIKGHARVLAAEKDKVLSPAVLATPLYIEYASIED